CQLRLVERSRSFIWLNEAGSFAWLDEAASFVYGRAGHISAATHHSWSRPGGGVADQVGPLELPRRAAVHQHDPYYNVSTARSVTEAHLAAAPKGPGVGADQGGAGVADACCVAHVIVVGPGEQAGAAEPAVSQVAHQPAGHAGRGRRAGAKRTVDVARRGQDR